MHPSSQVVSIASFPSIFTECNIGKLWEIEALKMSEALIRIKWLCLLHGSHNIDNILLPRPHHACEERSGVIGDFDSRLLKL